MRGEHLIFVTGRLAEFSLRAVLEPLAATVGFRYSIEVLNITVAALMTTEWVARRLRPFPDADRLILPGYCQGELSLVEAVIQTRVERGPHDLRRLPEFFGQVKARPDDYGRYDIQILAEINHAPRLSFADLLSEAGRLRAAGADLIDVGCDPADSWAGVGEAVRALLAEGHRVSIDSMRTTEIAAATAAGAELVLSVNSQNRAAALDWGCEVVVLPDSPSDMASLDETVAFLAERNVPLRIDPVLEPIGFGFSASLGRYLDVRRRYPDAEMLMGVGNLTELTDVDSAGVNVLLLGFCQEQQIHSVLTTEVINWARTSVRECDLARRLVYHAVLHRTLPKRLDPRLVMLRDPKLVAIGDPALEQLARQIKDHNYRIFADGGRLHVVTAGQHWTGDDPFQLFDTVWAAAQRPLDPGHAFYLGYEMAKALTALTLGKDYRQDEPLDWGFLTRPETQHYLQRTPLDRNARPKEVPPLQQPQPTQSASPHSANLSETPRGGDQ
jgi:dihydropteroate synthase